MALNAECVIFRVACEQAHLRENWEIFPNSCANESVRRLYLETCHYLAGGALFFGGEGHNFFPLVWVRVTLFLKVF